MTFVEMVYKGLIRPRVFGMSQDDAEIAHEWGMEKLLKVQSSARLQKWAKSMFCYEHPMLKNRVLGLDFAHPLGLAAGFDKYCQIFSRAVPAFGWSFAEVGGITRNEQPGNPRPRMRRSSSNKALWNFMGFNNPGADKAQKAIISQPNHYFPLGLNVGKSKDTPLLVAAEDYAYTIKKLVLYVDYITLNPSSPNTEGLRNLQNKIALRHLIISARLAMEQAGRVIPLGVKISPDESDEQLADIIEVCRQTKISFIVATNTSTDRSRVPSFPQDRGGVSGDPLRSKSLSVQQRLYSELRGEIPLIGVGGIRNGDDLFDRIVRGAALCQVYTAWPFEGPDFVKRCLKRLVYRLKDRGFADVKSAIGAFMLG